MLEDIGFVERYFEIESMMLNAEGIYETKKYLSTTGWWKSANLEEVFELLAIPIVA